jgi:hypothetical protein
MGLAPRQLENFDPPRDRDGWVAKHDDPRLSAEDGVIRFVPPQQTHFDENKGCWRIASGAFDEASAPPYGMSVQNEPLLMQAGIDPASKAPSPDHGILRLNVGRLRALRCLVGYDPIPAEPDKGTLADPEHAEIWGAKKHKKKLRDFAEEIRAPNYPPAPA